jgi:anthranilate phosphoribosyltransferase
VLEALGARIDLGPVGAARALEEIGFCFLFARRFHPSMRNVARVRETLGVRTLFNWIGPLANPAGATHQLVGIPDRSRLETMARVLQALGAARALVVHGGGGLDELSLVDGNEAILVEQGSPLRRLRIDATDLGFGPAPRSALQGGDAAANAAITRALLSGERGPKRDAVVLNAAAALWVAGRAESVEAGVTVAQEALDSGAVARTLARYVEYTHSVGEE